MERCNSHFQPNMCSHGRHLHDDRISSLPDELVLIILSFLTVKEMLKTNVLSSRWLNLWMNTPVLDFQGPVSSGSQPGLLDRMECKNCIEWVNHVLRRHKCHYLKKFKTAFHLNIDYQKDIDSWLEFALARKVEILELNFLLHGCVPGSVINNYAFPDRFLRFDLTCLKSLSLKNVDVAGEAINFILLSCPFLERLELFGNRKLVNLVISDPTLVLKYLQIKHCVFLKVLSISNFKLVSLDTSVGDLNLRDLPMLAELSLVGCVNNLSHSFSQVASFHPQLEALTLHAFNLEEVTRLSNLGQLTRLKRLVIDVGAWRDESLTMLLSFMKSCHCLEEFVLQLIWYNPKRTSRMRCEVERFGGSSPLKVFEFKGYYGRISDIDLIMHVVVNAPDLEKIVIETQNLISRHYNIPVDIPEQEARIIAFKQIEYLRGSKFIPPHVHVVIS